MAKKKRGSTKRVEHLIELLRKRAASNRTGEWFTEEMLPDITKTESNARESIIFRRALAFEAMLKVMISPENSKTTHTYEIKPGELIVGTMPMGSLGFGKVFPNYLTEEEKEVAFFSSRSIDSVLAHNVPDYKRVLDKGLKNILKTCKSRLASLEMDRRYPMGKNKGVYKKIAFYKSVEICCKAVVNYAKKFADLASNKAAEETDAERAKELQEISEICRKVPKNPATTFHEALQSIWFVHLALHATASHLSLGRLDQILELYLEKDLSEGRIDTERALELLECFWIKGAERLTTNTEFLVEQDHTDFSTGMGQNPFLVDQEVTINQFMQNIVIGGQTPKAKDATNKCTFLLLDACASAGLPTPVLNVRLHKNSSDELIEKVAETLMKSDSGHPVIYNDEAIIPGLSHGDRIPVEEARDYVVDGCWEVLLNAKCDFNYNMISVLTALECALNGGALLTDSLTQLRGPKRSFMSPLAAELKTFEQLKDSFKKHLRYFTNKAGMELYSFYMLEGSSTPTPFFSALLGKCLDKGIDKTWGGADYTLSGVVFYGMPNCANALAAIKQWVYDKKEYSIEEVVQALKNNFKGYEEMRDKFEKHSPKFGNGDPAVDDIMAWLADSVLEAVKHAEELADKVFLTIPKTVDEMRNIKRLRRMAGYSGISMREHFGEDFNIAFATGCGTFAQYAFLGMGCGASADGRFASKPVAPNFSPTSGTATHGAGAVLASLKGLGLDRFGLGVITDMCFDEKSVNSEFMKELILKFMENNGSIMTVTVVGPEEVEEIYNLCNEVRMGEKEADVLFEYNDVSVRVGGWNGPFVALTKVQQEDYLKRSLSKL